jgi:DNA ligase-1|tara:strand:+ start:533 stop:1807 length:1275 start_codon:yes stop_codon:yes gene_type:complete
MSKKIEGFIEKMRGTSSANVKVEIIKYESKFIHKVLEYTYNPFKQFHVTSKTCRKNLHLGQGLVGSVQHGNSYGLFEVLDKLIKREVTGHDAIKLVNGYALGDDSIYKIIDKDLGIRAGVTIINKAIDGLVPAFKVALAKEYESGKCNWNDGWYASRKLDGVRCLAITDEDGNCKLYSRMGKELTTLNKVKEAIEATNIVNTVFDGEICLVDEDGNEDFQGIMKQLRRKDHQIENPAYMMFDMLNIKDFNNQKSEEILSDRLHTLRSFLNIDTQILRYTEQALINDDEHFETWSKIADYFNWEGVMLRKDVGYEGKRTKNLVKVKQFHDAEYEVIDYDNDDHEVVRDGKSETIKMLAQVWIEHKGYRVKVGSGWSQEQRLQYMDGSIVGKIITVQYFEETYNDKGGISLRFPTVKVVHGEEREV